LFIDLFILSLAISLLLCCIYIFAKDISHIWQVSMSMLFFLSPILYNLSTFKMALPSFDYVSPIAGLITYARYVVLEERNPDVNLMIFDMVYAVVLLIAGLFILNKVGSKAAEKL